MMPGYFAANARCCADVFAQHFVVAERGVCDTSRPANLVANENSRLHLTPKRRAWETSAKKNVGCEELKQAILARINWDEIPCRTTEVLFKRLQEEIIHLKDEGRVLMRFNELRETLQLRLSGEFNRFADRGIPRRITT